mmetsp:Transcript_28069/g.69721  ORF Transcript_28069/g.69721 Transcript_28069/m.69721 type:complete len:205 (-) Transcript_28069:248-862(-)
MEGAAAVRVALGSEGEAMIELRNAAVAASRASDARSAPENPLQRRSVAIAAKSTEAESGMRRTAVRKISVRSCGVGSGTYSSLSRRPGRSIAGSSISGRLVAAMTKTDLRPSSPSISVSIWLTTRSVACEPDSEPRRGTRASSSSKKMTHGAEARPRAKSCRTARSDSPTNLLISSGPFTAMKEAPLSLAIALARSVLPQPGGP